MNTLLRFPEFSSIDLPHKRHIGRITNGFRSYSDFNFASLFNWDTEGITGVADLYGNVVVRFNDYITGDVFFSFLGVHRLTETLDALFEYCRKAGMHPRLRLVGQEVVDALPVAAKKQLVIEEDRDSHDYILSVQELCEFKTSRYPTKKRMYNRFSRDHGARATCRPLDLREGVQVKEIDETLSQWQKSRGKSDEEVRNEAVAIQRCVAHASELGVEAYGAYLSGRLVAFTLYEILPGGVAMGHFLKADADIDGVFVYLLRNFAAHLDALGVRFLNIQQDLGIKGLRENKESYKPVEYLKKYTITERGA